MSAIEGLRVLVVEDEGPVAMLLEDMLDDLGCTVAFSVATVADALKVVAEADFDLAILDVNVAGQRVDPVADALAGRGTPFVFASGYGASGVADRLRDRPIIQKPFRIGDLAGAMLRALGAQDLTTPAAPP